MNIDLEYIFDKCIVSKDKIKNQDLKDYDIEEQFKNQVIHMIGSHINEWRNIQKRKRTKTIL